MPAGALLRLTLYLLALLLPLLIMVFSDTPGKYGWLWDIAIVCGLLALGMMCMQFLLTGRFRVITAPFGIDVIYRFHRYLAYVLLLLALLHPLLLLLARPQLLGQTTLDTLLDWPLLTGILALGGLILITMSSVFRQRFQLPYDVWRWLHLILSILTVGSALTHLWIIGYYTGPTLERLFWGGVAIGLIALVCHVRLVRPWRMLHRPWRITRITPERGNCTHLEIRPEGHDGLRFSAGQFAWLSIGHSPFLLSEHPFSMAAAPRDDGSLHFTIKALGDFTHQLPELPEGTPVWVDGPYGIFTLNGLNEAKGFIFIAGGIGIAPIFSLLEALAQAGDQRQHVLFSAHSEWERIPRRDELLALQERLSLKVVFVLEDPPDDWDGESGYLDKACLEKYLPRELARHHAFLCGPGALTDAASKHLRALGLPAGHLHSELFEMA